MGSLPSGFVLSQRAAQHDAILATLALLQPPPADRAEQRLPAVITQVLQVLRRDAGQPWPGDAVQRAALDAAEVESRRLQRAVLAHADFSPGVGRYVLVQAAQPASFALSIDAQGLVPADWPYVAGVHRALAK